MPRKGSTIVHPDILAATGRFTMRATIQRATVTVNATGDEVLTWADLCEDVPCLVSINGPGGGTPGPGVRRGEVRRREDELVFYSYTIDLVGVRDVTAKDRALVAGKTYEVMAVEYDSQGIMTRLLCEVVE